MCFHLFTYFRKCFDDVLERFLRLLRKIIAALQGSGILFEDYHLSNLSTSPQDL